MSSRADFHRWEHEDRRRYYEARVLQDLFGGWIVHRVWGGIGSRFGGQQTDPVLSERAAIEAVALLDRRGRKRGYVTDGEVLGGDSRTGSASI
jgi:predicted DNA-binding WGR domain protein